MAIEKVNPIRLTDTDTNEEFVLEFNRDTVVWTNNHGFVPSKVDDNVEEMLPILWFGAFRMHHRNVSRAKTDELIQKIGGITPKLLERLVDLYTVPRSTLIVDEDEDSVKNAVVTVEF